MELEDIILEELMAFLPVYLSMKGNCTLLYTNRGGQYELESTIRTILNQLSQYYLIDLRAIRKHYSNILNIKNLVPIPFNEENIFVPIKVRKPLCKNDGSFGYVNIKYIKKVSIKKGKALIYLKNDDIIECLSSVETVNKHIKNGKIVKKLYQQNQRGNIVKEYDLYKEYDKPATKADIALLINEILKMRG